SKSPRAHPPSPVRLVILVAGIGASIAAVLLGAWIGLHSRASGTQRHGDAPSHSFGPHGDAAFESGGLESALLEDAAEIGTPQERGYRTVVPSRRSRDLAARIGPAAPPFALGLKAIVDGQFDTGRRDLAQASRQEPPFKWRADAALSVLELFAGRYNDAAAAGIAAADARPDDAGASLEAAVALLNAGRIADASKRVDASVKLQEKQGAVATPLFAATLDVRAITLGARGRFPEAVADFQRAIAVRTRAVGPDCAGNARSLNRLATLYDAQGRFAASEPLYERALAIVRRVYGKDSVEAAACLNNQGGHYAMQREFDRADSVFTQALNLQTRLLGDQSLETAETLNNLAGICAERGRLKEAEELFARALQVQVKSAGPNSLDVAQTMDNLASIFTRQGRMAEAESFYKQELDAREQALGPDHHDTAVTLNNLACLYTRLGRFNEAARLFKRAIDIHVHLGDSADPEAANAFDNYAVLLRKMGHAREARNLELRAQMLRGARK
ncbi:MAG TPA: tetratricopeptide repeat protein, partial [Chthonomonadaceae bacterium]|nr:tetratricopeptide repeat protein [Chthonomonadaceae bacterium]